jgi:hypothetical protein
MSKSKKQVERLKEEHRYYDKKVAEMEQERVEDRSWAGKELLKRHKKIKLALKDAIAKFKNNI